MRFAVTIAVLLAVVATALVGVCQHSETRRLEHAVWQLEQRKARLESAARRLAAAAAAARTPRRLLDANDAGPRRPAFAEPAPPAARDTDVVLPPGFVLGDHFEEDGR